MAPPKGKKGPPAPPPDPRALATLDLLKQVFPDREPALNLNQVEMPIGPAETETVCRVAKADAAAPLRPAGLSIRG